MRTRITAVVLLVALAAPLQAEEKPSPAAAAEALRAELPPPNPGIAVAWHGDLLIQGLWAGEIRLSGKLARAGRDFVWRLTEDSFLDWAGGEVHEKLMVHAGRDLAVLGGTYERTDRDGTQSLGFSRTDSGFDVQRRVRKDGAWGETEAVTMRTAPRPVAGLAAVLFFVRSAGLPAKGVAWSLPYVGSSAFKAPTDATPGEAVLRGEGDTTWTPPKEGSAPVKTTQVRFEAGGTSWDLHFERGTRTLRAMVSTTGPVLIVPAGTGGERITADPSAPATTWKQAFLKFGFGYHMARRELLAEAFLWDRMRAYEVETLKRWPAERPVEEFREAWIDEFVAGSKHRDVPATRRLLAMTLATGKIREQTEDTVVFWAHPNFGGGTQRTYHLAKEDGRWGIWRIDFEQ